MDIITVELTGAKSRYAYPLNGKDVLSIAVQMQETSQNPHQQTRAIQEFVTRTIRRSAIPSKNAVKRPHSQLSI